MSKNRDKGTDESIPSALPDAPALETLSDDEHDESKSSGVTVVKETAAADAPKGDAKNPPAAAGGSTVAADAPEVVKPFGCSNWTPGAKNDNVLVGVPKGRVDDAIVAAPWGGQAPAKEPVVIGLADVKRLEDLRNLPHVGGLALGDVEKELATIGEPMVAVEKHAAETVKIKNDWDKKVAEHDRAMTARSIDYQRASNRAGALLERRRILLERRAALIASARAAEAARAASKSAA